MQRESLRSLLPSQPVGDEFDGHKGVRSLVSNARSYLSTHVMARLSQLQVSPIIVGTTRGGDRPPAKV